MAWNFNDSESRELYAYAHRVPGPVTYVRAPLSSDSIPRGLTVAVGGLGEITFPRLDATVERRFRRALRSGPIKLATAPGYFKQRFGAASDDSIYLEIGRLLHSGVAVLCDESMFLRIAQPRDGIAR